MKAQSTKVGTPWQPKREAAGDSVFTVRKQKKEGMWFTSPYPLYCLEPQPKEWRYLPARWVSTPQLTPFENSLTGAPRSLSQVIAGHVKLTIGIS